MHAAHAGFPMLVDRLPGNAEDWNAEAALITRSNLETRGVNYAIYRVFLTVGYDAVFGDRLDTLRRANINQLNVFAVERIKIKIIAL